MEKLKDYEFIKSEAERFGVSVPKLFEKVVETYDGGRVREALKRDA